MQPVTPPTGGDIAQQADEKADEHHGASPCTNEAVKFKQDAAEEAWRQQED